jgi:hypothetical protein
MPKKYLWYICTIGGFVVVPRSLTDFYKLTYFYDCNYDIFTTRNANIFTEFSAVKQQHSKIIMAKNWLRLVKYGRIATKICSNAVKVNRKYANHFLLDFTNFYSFLTIYTEFIQIFLLILTYI